MLSERSYQYLLNVARWRASAVQEPIRTESE